MELIKKPPVERFELDGGWVDLRTRLTIGERKRLAGAAVGISGAGQGASVSLDIAAVEMLALEIGIVSWSLPDDLTPDNIALLDEDTGDRIKRRLDELWKSRTDDERKNSSGGGQTSAAAKGAPASSDGSP